ncbi:MAG: ATP-binding protein [Alphaproteobacteria bacterium]
MHKRKRKKPTLLKTLLSPFTKGARAAAEKARLESFLAAFPGEYCGFASDGSIAYSSGFCDTLGVTRIETIADIQNMIPPGDAAALEGYFDRLSENGAEFILLTRNLKETKSFQITGSQGFDRDGGTRFDILWIKDITEETAAQKHYAAEAIKKEAEYKRYADSLAGLPYPCWLRDEDQKIIWVNDSYVAVTGELASTIIKDQKELATPTRKSKEQKKLLGAELAKAAIDAGEEQTTETHIITGGKRLYVRLRETPVPESKITLGIAEDISDTEDLSEELKRYQSSNRDLLEQLRSSIAIYGADHQLEFYNSAYAQLWGLEDGWLNKKPKLGDVMEKLRENRRLPEQADFRRFKQSWLNMFTGLIKPHDEMLYLPDGSALRMLVVPHSLGGIMMTFEDVTSRLELESSYNTLIAVQKETLDNLAEAVAVYGGDGRLKLSNPAFGRLWDLNPEDLDGEPHVSRIVNKVSGFFTREEWPDRRDELIAKGLDRVMHEGRLKRADGSLVDFSTVPLPDGGVLITYTDVTDSVRVENALREKNAALETAERLKLDFLANVSYQLRTPLNAIMGFNEILDQEFFGKLNERQKQYTHDIHDASMNLLGLINDILDLSTLEAGYMTLQREDVKIYGMMQSIKDLVSDWARKKQIEVHLSCAKNIGQLSADEKRLKQAIINVIRNAINFTPEGGKIDLTARRKKDGIAITVTDNGVGINKEDKSRIFAPFERAQSGSVQLGENKLIKTGAGLGLSLVKNITALHGGDVKIDSEPGKGTTVTIYIPLASVETPLKLPLKNAS